MTSLRLSLVTLWDGHLTDNNCSVGAHSASNFIFLIYFLLLWNSKWYIKLIVCVLFMRQLKVLNSHEALLNCISFFSDVLVFAAVWALLRLRTREPSPQLQGAGFSRRWPLWLGARAWEHVGFSSCSEWPQWVWPPGSGEQAQESLHGFSSHVGSSRTRDWPRVFFFGLWILYHWATKQGQVTFFFLIFLKFLFFFNFY